MLNTRNAIAGLFVAALGGLAAVAIASQPGDGGSAASAATTERPRVRTEVVKRTKHVRGESRGGSRVAAGSSSVGAGSSPTGIAVPASTSTADDYGEASSPAPTGDDDGGYADDEHGADPAGEPEDDSGESDESGDSEREHADDEHGQIELEDD